MLLQFGQRLLMLMFATQGFETILIVLDVFLTLQHFATAMHITRHRSSGSVVLRLLLLCCGCMVRISISISSIIVVVVVV